MFPSLAHVTDIVQIYQTNMLILWKLILKKNVNLSLSTLKYKKCIYLKTPVSAHDF